HFNSGNLNEPVQFAITGNILYVVNFSDNTVEIYNISNPINPIHVGQFNSGNLNEPNILAIADTTLYVSNIGDNTIEIYNISNPTAPVHVGQFGAEDLDVPNGLAVLTLLGDSTKLQVISCCRAHFISTF
ncbi:hypothetical protein, partial [Bacillus pseudomycoides]